MDRETTMHDEAIRAAREALQAVSMGGQRQRFTDEYAEAMTRAAITAFLERVEVSEAMLVAGDDHDAWNRHPVMGDTFCAMLAQLRREL